MCALHPHYHLQSECSIQHFFCWKVFTIILLSAQPASDEPAETDQSDLWAAHATGLPHESKQSITGAILGGRLARKNRHLGSWTYSRSSLTAILQQHNKQRIKQHKEVIKELKSLWLTGIWGSRRHCQAHLFCFSPRSKHDTWNNIEKHRTA